MTDRDDAERMLTAARNDLKALRNMLDADRFADSIFGFHAQQVAEKVLKAWLSLRGEAYPKTHDLRVLFQLLEAQGESGWQRHLDLVDLTDFAVQFRYDAFDSPEGLDRPSLLAAAEDLFGHVEGLVRGPVSADCADYADDGAKESERS